VLLLLLTGQVIASAGQISTHSAQPVHRSGRQVSRPPTGRIACVGQVSRQAPQPVHAFVKVTVIIGAPAGLTVIIGAPAGVTVATRTPSG
jgi:hypothetical protein